MATRDPGGIYLRAFGRAVRDRRTAAKLSQEDPGLRADIDRTYISGVERGVRNPTLRMIVRIAAALGADPSDLVAAAHALANRT